MTVYETGYCWLAAVEAMSVAEARGELGAWPSARELVEAPAEWFLGTSELERVCITVSEGNFHCEMATATEAAAHALAVRPTFAGALASLALSVGCAAGTLGARLVQEHPAVRISAVDVARCEAVRFGGESSRFVRPEFPVGGSAAAMVQYYRALNGYNVGLLVELLTSEVLVQTHEESSGEMVGDEGSAEDLGGAAAAGSGVCSGPGVAAVASAGVTSGPRRGPNYIRNQAARMRKKVQRDERRLAEAEARGRGAVAGGYFTGCSEETQVKLRESRAQLLILENERRTVEERRKLEKLKSPVALVKDAMELVGLAGKYAAMAGDSKVAGWAATVSSSYAESLARSPPSSVPSLASVASVRSAEEAAAVRRRVVELPLNRVEEAAVDTGVLSRAAVLDARINAGRVLVCADFTRESAPFTLSLMQVRAIRTAAAVDAGSL